MTPSQTYPSVLLASRLAAAAQLMTAFRVMESFSMVQIALEDAARAGVTLGPEHLEHVSSMHTFFKDGYPSSCVADAAVPN